jgi:putative RNA 2'-phosphotransferase
MTDHIRTTAVDLAALSRITSHALRHQPWLYELELDDEGWTPVESLLSALRKEREEWSDLCTDDLAHMIIAASKRRHEMRQDRIRALYGHSVAGKLKKTPAIPPDVLFHGTSPDVLPQLRSAGLIRMKRQYVHLSTDEATALEVGRRKSKTPVLLRVLAKEATAKGVCFYEGNEKVWLADSVPSEFIFANSGQIRRQANQGRQD